MRVFAFIVALLMSAPVYAQGDVGAMRYPEGMWSPALLGQIKAGPGILPRDTIFEVAPPPANDSLQVKAELEQLHNFEAERTDATVARIEVEDQAQDVWGIFAAAGLIAPDNFKTMELLALIDRDNSYFVLERKMHFARPRPSMIDNTMDLVIPDPPHASYPSGHAAQSYMTALVLSDFDPEHADEYKQFAMDIAHRREVAGIHYPSDSEAGRKLAQDVYAALRAVPVFETKYQDAKASYIKPSL